MALKFRTLSSPYTDCISIFTFILLNMIASENISFSFDSYFLLINV